MGCFVVSARICQPNAVRRIYADMDTATNSHLAWSSLMREFATLSPDFSVYLFRHETIKHPITSLSMCEVL